MSADFSGYIVPYHQPTYAGHTAVKSQISNLYFKKVKHSSGFLLHIKYNYITIFNNNKYISKESLKNTTQNYTKLHLFSMNAVYLT